MTESQTLERIAATLEPTRLYCPATILEHALANGILMRQDREAVEWDYHRLALVPFVQEWPEAGLGTIQREGRPSTMGWPGQMWTMAIQEGIAFENKVVPEFLSQLPRNIATAC